MLFENIADRSSETLLVEQIAPETIWYITDAVFIDCRIRLLLEAEFERSGRSWSDGEAPLVMHLAAPLKWLTSRFRDMTRFAFSIRPHDEDHICDGIPVIAVFQKDDVRGYHFEVRLDDSAKSHRTRGI